MLFGSPRQLFILIILLLTALAMVLLAGQMGPKPQGAAVSTHMYQDVAVMSQQILSAHCT